MSIGLNPLRWSIASPYYCRPYKRSVIDAVNQLNPFCLVEIGSGSCDIIARCSCTNRLAIDLDIDSFAFAKRIYPFHLRNVKFSCIDVCSMDFKEIQSFVTLSFDKENIDGSVALICLNWLHSLPSSTVYSLFANLVSSLNRQTIYLVFDTIYNRTKAHEFFHDIDDILPPTFHLLYSKTLDFHRCLHVVKVSTF